MPTVLTELQKNAIVRISFSLGVGLGQRRGTGFVVSRDGLILTAFHVIQGRVRGKMHDGPITLRFGSPAAPVEREVKAEHLKAHSVEDDWALLQCPNPPTGVEPFRLEERRLADETEWVSFGFSDDAPDDGDHYGGFIRGTGSPIVLYGMGVQETRIPGLSGSPCVVNGSVVGLIIETGAVHTGPAGETLARTGSLYVFPIARVTGASKLLELHQGLPFQNEVCQRLALVPSSYLDRSVQALNLTGVETLAEFPKRERVAEAMLRGGADTALAGMLGICDALAPNPGNEILEFAATMWIGQQSIQWLEEQVLHEPLRPIALNASQFDTGRRSLHRAGYRIADHPGWSTLQFKILCQPGDGPMGRVLIEQIRKELTAEFPEGIAEGLRNQRELKRPAFVLIQGEPPPPTSELLEVQHEFPDLIILVLVSPAAQPEFYQAYRSAGIVVVDPLLDAGREQREHAAYQKASAALNRTFRALNKLASR